MYAWERRLKDLAQALINCEQAYFEPNLFRMNTNQFLQTSRTVTFLIQKHKAEIPSFDSWYAAAVIDRWASDQVMQWAKDSRNKVEKEGDLDVHSSLEARLIFSYIEENDIVIPCGRDELVGANIKRLFRFARRQLPTGVSDAAVIKIDRRWVANSLPNWELLHAFTYVYARIREACAALARHLGSSLSATVPDSSRFDELMTDARHVSYVKLADGVSGRLAATRLKMDRSFTPAPELAAIFAPARSDQEPVSFEDNVRIHANRAKAMFEHYGYHFQTLFMLDEQGKHIDLMSARLDDQATKYLFWRSVADRVLYLKPDALIWVSEAWVRNDLKNDFPSKPYRKLPIVGETLHVVGMDRNLRTVCYLWDIRRDTPESPPRLEESTPDKVTPNYLIPIRRAFEKLRLS